MICDKCGKVLPDGAKFCGRCGASLSRRAVPKPEPVPKQVFEPVPAPVTEPKPEKVSSPKTKKLILFGAIGAAVVAAALVVLFVVILPAVNGGKSGDSKDSKSAVVSGTGEQSADASDGIKLDILSYVKEHDLITQTGSSDWNLDVAVKAFEAEINGCKIRKPDDEPLTEVSVRDPNGNKAGSFMFKYDGEFSAGGEVAIDYNPTSTTALSKKGVILIGDAIIYTVKASGNDSEFPDVHTYSSEYVDWFNNFIHSLDRDAAEKDVIELKNIYYNGSEHLDGDVIFVYYNSTQKQYKTVYQNLTAYSFSSSNSDMIVSNGRIKFSDGYKTIDEALKNCDAYDTSDGKTPEKIY